ncbi:UNVERIFIED_CONTAM: hypothetical protein HDU68_008711 [Siphonaria sp. JEL0065]|nr:hypothetical protein HDU68_008711 [Siphonaria sp. JEL0065]
MPRHLSNTIHLIIATLLITAINPISAYAGFPTPRPFASTTKVPPQSRTHRLKPIDPPPSTPQTHKTPENNLLFTTDPVLCPLPKTALIGIQSIPKDINTIRRQYLRALYTKVLKTHKQHEFTFKFVYGAGTSDIEKEERELEEMLFPEDTVVLEEKENMDDGKTFDWFVESRRFLFHTVGLVPGEASGNLEAVAMENDAEDGKPVIAVERRGYYRDDSNRPEGKAIPPEHGSKPDPQPLQQTSIICPLYRFVGKGDDDTTIHIPRLFAFLNKRAPPPQPPAQKQTIPPPHLAPSLQNSTAPILPPQNSTTPTAFPAPSVYFIGAGYNGYMTGLFYLLSTQILDQITTTSHAWCSSHKNGFEDAQTGAFVRHVTEGVKNYVTIGDTNAEFHDHWDSPNWDSGLITGRTVALHWNKDIGHFWRGLQAVYGSDGLVSVYFLVVLV